MDVYISGVIEMMDEQLIRRLIAKEEDALEELIRRCSPTVWKIALAITKNYHDAQDVTQETLLKVIKEKEKIKWDKFERWLKKVTTNTARDKVRMRNRLRRRFLPLDQIEEEELCVQPEGEDERERVLRCLMEVIGELPEDDRRLIREKYMGGISYERLMEERGLSFHQLKNRLYRLRVEIREEVRRRLEGLYSLIGMRTLEVMVMGWKKVMISLIVAMVIAGGGLVIWRHGGEKTERVKVRREAKGMATGEASEKSASVKRGSREDGLTFEEFNKLLDEVLSGEREEKRIESPSSAAEGGKDQEKKDVVHQPEKPSKEVEEEKAISQEIKGKVIQLVSNIYDLNQELQTINEQLTQRVMTVSREEYEKERGEFEEKWSEETDISRDLISLGRELKRLIPDGVRIFKRRWFEEIPNMYVVSYTIYVKPDVENVIPEIDTPLPLTAVTLPVPEDESLTIVDLMNKGRERIKRDGLSPQEIARLGIKDFETAEEK